MNPKDISYIFKVSKHIISETRSLLKINFLLEDFHDYMEMALNMKDINTYLILVQLLV